jgi:hypothetical protein
VALYKVKLGFTDGKRLTRNEKHEVFLQEHFAPVRILAWASELCQGTPPAMRISSANWRSVPAGTLGKGL